MKIEEIKEMLITAQYDIIRMSGNAKTQKEAEKALGNLYESGFHSGNIYAFAYACKHLTNIIEMVDKTNP